jgi:predicted sugar kinase
VYLLDGGGVAGLGAEVIQQLSNTRLAIRILALRVDNPDLAEVDGRGERSTLGVAGNVLDVLDTAALKVC